MGKGDYFLLLLFFKIFDEFDVEFTRNYNIKRLIK
jgi:hypothetical protein